MIYRGHSPFPAESQQVTLELGIYAEETYGPFFLRVPFLEWL